MAYASHAKKLENQRKWREKNRDRIRAYALAWKAKNIEKVRKDGRTAMAKWRADNRERWLFQVRESRRAAPEQTKAAAKKYYAAHAEERRAKRRAYAATEHGKQVNKQWREKNAEKIKQRARASFERRRMESYERRRKWGKENPEKIRTAARSRYQTNPAKYVAQTAERRTISKAATPRWLTNDHRSQIAAVYAEAARLGLTVDHIVPLKGKTVCGLHVPWNLQLMTAAENSRKSNRITV